MKPVVVQKLRCAVGVWLVSCVLSAMLLLVPDHALAQHDVDLPGTDATTHSPGRIRYLYAGDNLQKALDQARSGDVLMLEAGARFAGPFVLKAHAGPEWITITSQHRTGQPLPAAGTRITAADMPAMATLSSTRGPVLRTEPGAARYRLIGLHVTTGDAATETVTLIELSSGDNRAASMPHHIVLERSYLHGDEHHGTRRGIVMNGAHMAVIDSHLSGFKSREDAQAIAGWEGTGPFLVQNNFLEATGENLMFGGADPAIDGRVPSDIVIRGNHFSKPLHWRIDDSAQGNSQNQWSVKNLLELKNASRVLIDGNLFEHNWPQAQNGFAILFTVRNQEGGSPWSRVDSVVFSNNIVRHVAAGINILGYDDNHRSGQTRNIRIVNNLFYDVGYDWGSGHLLQLLNGPAAIDIQNNTALQSGPILMVEGPAIDGMRIQNNVFLHNDAGISGTGTAPGQASIDTYFAAPSILENNLLIGPGDASYTQPMIRIRSMDAMPFVAPEKWDFRLQPGATSPAYTSPGVDFNRLCLALSVTERPAYC